MRWRFYMHLQSTYIYIHISLLFLNLILVILLIVTTTIAVTAIDIAMVLAIIRVSLMIINLLLLLLLPFLLLLLSIHNQLILFHLYLQMHIIFTEWAVLVAKKRCALHPCFTISPDARLITSKVTRRNRKLLGVCQDSSEFMVWSSPKGRYKGLKNMYSI